MTEDAHENTVRPRGYYRSCQGCRIVVLTLADVDDGLSLCRSVAADWARRAGAACERVDLENVTGELFACLWGLYNKWVPSFGAGGGTFTGYATGILRRRIHRYVAVDVGDPLNHGGPPKAHSRNLADSFEGLVEQQFAGGEHGLADSTGGLDFALGVVAPDPTYDLVADRDWLDTLGAVTGHGSACLGAD